VALGNQSEGIEINGASGTTIGGTAPGAGNVVAANSQEGIWVINGATGTVIQGNWIGTDVTGTVNLGNIHGGIRIGNVGTAANGNLIGGTTAGAGNIIAFNAEAGVAVDTNAGTSSVNNAILGNAIYSNTGIGIDLDDIYASPSSPSVTANDAGDADAGGNNRQNFPVLASAATYGAQLIVSGSLNSTPNSYFRVEFFSNTAQDGTGYGEGQTYLGFVNVTTDGSGDATFNTALTASVAAGSYLSSTATKSDATFTSYAETSEFSADVLVSALSLTIVKQVWELNGSAPLSSPVNAPAGSTLVFLIYVKNTTAIQVTDIRINDLLDQTGFDHVAGSMVRTLAATPPADTATDKQIFDATALGTGTVLSDAVDGDVGSAQDTGVPAGVDRITIGAAAGQANAALSINAHTTFAFRFEVKVK
jgi:hypothetical protein